MSTQEAQRITEAVREFILSSIRISDLGNDDNLFESGIVNSLFAVQLMTFIERTFGIDIVADDLDVENFKSLNATTAFVMRKYGGIGRCDPAEPGHVLDARTPD